MRVKLDAGLGDWGGSKVRELGEQGGRGGGGMGPGPY